MKWHSSKNQLLIKKCFEFHEKFIKFAEGVDVPSFNRKKLIESTEIAFLFRGIKYYRAILSLVFSASLYEPFIILRALNELIVLYLYLFSGLNDSEKRKRFQIYYLHSLYENYYLLQNHREVGKRKIKADIAKEEKELKRLFPRMKTKNIKAFCRSELTKAHSVVKNNILKDRKILIFPEIYKFILDILKPSSGDKMGKDYKIYSNMLHNNFFNIYGTDLNPRCDNYNVADILKKASDSMFLFFSLWNEGRKYKAELIVSAYKKLKI